MKRYFETQILSEEIFLFFLEQECKRSVRYADFFSVLTVKLEIQDRDDPLLSTLSNLIRDVIRGSDMIGLLRGSTLAVLLHHADAQDTHGIGIAAKVRGRVQDSVTRFRQDLEIQNIRVGAACFPTHASTLEGLLEAAQDSLS